MTANPHADVFEAWLKTHPAPDLQAFVDHWGGWDKIPGVAWDDFTRQGEEWEIARLNRLYGHQTWSVRNEMMGRPSRRARKK